MAKKPTKKSSPAPRKAPAAQRGRNSRKPVSRNASKAPVGRAARRQHPRSRYEERDDRYYELDTFAEREVYSEPEYSEQPGDEMLSEFSHGDDDFFVD